MKSFRLLFVLAVLIVSCAPDQDGAHRRELEAAREEEGDRNRAAWAEWLGKDPEEFEKEQEEWERGQKEALERKAKTRPMILEKAPAFDLYAHNYRVSHMICASDAEDIYREAGTRNQYKAAEWLSEGTKEGPAKWGSHQGCVDALMGMKAQR